MDDCCGGKADELAKLGQKHEQSRVLWVVLVINAVMFFVEFGGAYFSRSTGLFADSLDMAGDAFVYGVSLMAIHRSSRWNAATSLLKGLVMATFGFGILAQAIYRIYSGTPPEHFLMGGMATAAFAANLTCALLLLRHRSDDLNMRSTWLCSRNDVISNLAVLGAAFLVAWTGSLWPDVVIGTLIAGLVLKTSFGIVVESRAALAKV